MRHSAQTIGGHCTRPTKGYSHESLAPRRGQPGVKSSNGEPLSSPESKRATTHQIHPKTTPTNTSDRSVCRFGDMCKSARCPWYHPTESGTTQQPQWEAGSDMLPPRRRTPAAGSMQGAHALHKGGGCAPRARRCPPRGWQQGRDQPTAHRTVHVVRRCEILVRGGKRVGQEWVRERGTQERP